MANRTLKHCTASAGLTVVLSFAAITAATTPGSADPRWGQAAAVGAGVGFVAGAAAAAATAPYSGYGPGYGAGYYDYDPDAVVVTPAPNDAAPSYHDASPAYGWQRPGECRFSIRGC